MTARPLDIDSLVLYSGDHDPNGKMCIMEAVAYVAGEPWSDRPVCASTVISDFLRSWNDALNDDDRQMLKPFILRMVGTSAQQEVELMRSELAWKWLVRTYVPTWLDAAGIADHANKLRSCRETEIITTLAAARAAARDTLRPTVQKLQQSALDLVDRMIIVDNAMSLS